jgi:hypothetical protein
LWRRVKLENFPLQLRPIYFLSLQKDKYSGRGLARALEQISGVNILTTGNGISKPMIHGMFGSRVGIIYDGIQIENQQWGQDHAPNIDQNAFDEIRLVKGAGVLKYSGDTPVEWWFWKTSFQNCRFIVWKINFKWNVKWTGFKC